jgi:hypothetical protein
MFSGGISTGAMKFLYGVKSHPYGVTVNPGGKGQITSRRGADVVRALWAVKRHSERVPLAPRGQGKPVCVRGTVPAWYRWAVRSLRFPGESDEEFRSRAERAGRIARALVEACLRNAAIQAMIADPSLPYTEEYFRRCPAVRLEFEQAFAVGGIGECLDATKNKHWGDGPWIMPLDPEDPVAPDRILYVYRPNSLYNRRFLQRRRLKELLGKDDRRLVGMAMRSRKRDFLRELIDSDVAAIRGILSLDAGEFWRAARGKRFLKLPPPEIQRELDFESAEHGDD